MAIRKKWFPITSVHRDDLVCAGLDGYKISDEKIARLVARMRDAYLEYGFWADMKRIAEDMMLPDLRSSR